MVNTAADLAAAYAELGALRTRDNLMARLLKAALAASIAA